MHNASLLIVGSALSSLIVSTPPDLLLLPYNNTTEATENSKIGIVCAGAQVTCDTATSN